MSIKRFPANLEYKRDENLSRDVVLEILDWVQNEPHLPKIKEEDVILFLASCNYSSEVAKQTIDLFYTYRTHFPELFLSRDPLFNNNYSDVLQESSGYYIALPGVTDEGHKVMYCTMKTGASSKFSLLREIKMLTLVLDNILYEEGAHQGFRVIYDMDGASASDVTQLSPTIIKKLVGYFLNASPIRVKGLHMIRPAAFVDYFLSLLKPFLNKSAGALLEVHTTLEDLYKAIPKKMLPSEVGGNLQTCLELYDKCKIKIVENRDYFTAEEKLRVDESKRPVRPKTAADLFGVEGSFRKLDID